MNLAVDIGNTRLKIGLFEHDRLIKRLELDKTQPSQELDPLITSNTIENVLVAATGESKKIVTWLQEKGLSVTLFDHKTPLPFKNLYKTPRTLGIDRLALVSASAKAYPNQNVLVIDAGTCVTYDFLNSKNEYKGGSISPGLTMRYKALNTFTARLPYLEPKADIEVIGNDTQTAIHSGVVHGMSLEIDGLIDWYKGKYNDLTVILTGGDGLFLSKTLKNGIFANSNFLLEGLNYIILFNANQ